VLVGAGAKVLGPFTVGDNVRIGGNAVVLQEVPPNATVVGVPGNIIMPSDAEQEYPSWELDQIGLPDPIQQEIDDLQTKLDALSEYLRQCKCGGNCPVKCEEDENK
jgi:serine O-acetyltransferase